MGNIRMNKIEEKLHFKKLLNTKKNYVIAAVILLITVVTMFSFIPIAKSISDIYALAEKYVNENTNGTLSEEQEVEVASVVSRILEDSGIVDESMIEDRLDIVEKKLQDQLLEFSYLTEEETEAISSNMNYFIQNDYRNYLKEMNTKTTLFEELIKKLELQISTKAENSEVEKVEKTTSVLIEVDEGLKQTDGDLYTRLIELNAQLSKLGGHVDDISEESDQELNRIVNEFNILLTEAKADTTKDYSEKIKEMEVQINQYVTDITKGLSDIYMEMEKKDYKLLESIQNLESDTNGALDGLRAETDTSLGSLKTETDTALGSLKTETDTALSGMKTETDQAILNLSDSFQIKLEGLYAALGEQADQNRLELLGVKDSIATNQKSIGSINDLAIGNQKSIQDINTNVGENKSAISDLLSKMNACFQSVSDGKSLLASTLTDKGISTSPDATFGVINNHILNLYTAAFTAGVDSVAGINADVEYEYHYHTGNENSGGGCYTKENRHCHTGNSSNGGGCYTIPIYDISYYYPSCSGSWVKDTNSWGDKDGNRDRRYRGWCSVCGYYCASYSEWNSYPSEAGPTHTSLKATEIKTLRGYSLGCGFSEGQMLGYETACGMVDGQIISAKVNLTNAKTESADILTSLQSLKNMNIEASDSGVNNVAAKETTEQKETENTSESVEREETVSGNEVENPEKEGSAEENITGGEGQIKEEEHTVSENSVE